MELQSLEEWLVKASAPPPSSVAASGAAAASSSGASSRTSNIGPPARQIAQVWGEIRACLQRGELEPAHAEALSVIHHYRKSLHIADPQVKLLVGILTGVGCKDTQLLGQARASVALVLCAWLHKLLAHPLSATGAAPPMQQSYESTLALVVENTCKALQDFPVSDAYVCEAILLLGKSSGAPQSSQSLRQQCRQVVALELVKRKSVIVQRSVWNAIAGAGYAMAGVHDGTAAMASIFRALLSLWSFESKGREKTVEDYPPLHDVLMVFHLLEYQGLALSASAFSSTLSSSQQRDNLRSEEEDRTRKLWNLVAHAMTDASSPHATQCTALMAAAGLRQGLDPRRQETLTQKNSAIRHHHPREEWHDILHSLDELVIGFCEKALGSLQRIRGFSDPSDTNWGFVNQAMLLRDTGDFVKQLQHKLRCISLAVSRNRFFPPNSLILQSLVIVLLNDLLSLHNIYIAQTNDLQRQMMTMDSHHTGSALGVALEHLEMKVKGTLFQEVGAIARALCEQYKLANEETQVHTELGLWAFLQDLYTNHRCFRSLSGRAPEASTGALEKVLISTFMTVLMFFSRAIEDTTAGCKMFGGERAAQALDCLSCVEFCRHVQMQEYGALVKRTVLLVSMNQTATIAFVRFLPPYNSIIHGPGNPQVNERVYHWSLDEVQTARMSFYLRVLPLCLRKLPEAIFANTVAPIMFLYLQHPLEAVAKASHSLFASFLTTETEDKVKYSLTALGNEPPEAELREQLAVYYIERALEKFPAGTLFDALVFGIAAIMYQLPPGSPAAVHCIQVLVQKAIALQSMQNQSKSQEERSDKGVDMSEDAEKIQLLLLHLILRVDLQILPELLKQMARLILGLPTEAARSAALEDAFEIITSTNDYTRKPMIIPWLQSLAFLSSHPDVLLTSQSQQNSLHHQSRPNNNTRSLVAAPAPDTADNNTTTPILPLNSADASSQSVINMAGFI
ncbi:hypothetical protein BDL97_13G108100 [Sphagnum fallax]|nr:hypothetical protein BDL97_13G108100 [Sphagnum fallax]